MRDGKSIRPGVRWRFRLWIAAVVILLVGTPLWFFLIRGPRTISPDVLFHAGWITLSCVLLGVAILLHTTPADAIRLPARSGRRIILSGAIALHAAALALLWPALSDDVIRYRFDGRLTLAGLSPWDEVPSKLAEESPPRFEFDAIDRLMPFPQMATIYLPTSQAVFAAMAAIDSLCSPPIESGSDWRRSLVSFDFWQRAGVFRIGASVFALLATLEILNILRRVDRSPWWATLFAWHPLLIVETAGNAHQDSLGVWLVLLALRFVLDRRSIPAGVAFALAAAVKPIALVAALFALVRIKNKPRFVATGIGTAIVLGSVMLADGLDGWLETIRTYGRTWEFNGVVYQNFFAIVAGDVSLGTIEDKEHYRLVCGALVLVFAGVMLWRRVGVFSATAATILLSLVLAPVAYPWYLLWALAIVPLAGIRVVMPTLAWAATVGLSYIVLNLNEWRVPATILWVQLGAIPAGLITGFALRCDPSRASCESRPMPESTGPGPA